MNLSFVPPDEKTFLLFLIFFRKQGLQGQGAKLTPCHVRQAGAVVSLVCAFLRRKTSKLRK